MAFVFHGGTFKLNKTNVNLVNNVTKIETLVVPVGKRWLVLYGRTHNIDNVERTCYVTVRDAADVDIFDLLTGQALAVGGTYVFPDVGSATELKTTPYPIIIEGGMKVVFGFEANGASAGGTSIIFLVVLETTSS